MKRYCNGTLQIDRADQSLKEKAKFGPLSLIDRPAVTTKLEVKTLNLLFFCSIIDMKGCKISRLINSERKDTRTPNLAHINNSTFSIYDAKIRWIG